MIQTNLIPHGHSDLVTHVTYDFYGERLATCSADQRIKIFRRSAEGSWALETEWKAHDAPILRLSFAHPLHGSLLASCSHDRSVRIWEEPSTGSHTSPLSSGAGTGAGGGAGAGQNGAGAGAGAGGAKDGRWIERGVLSGAKGSVRGVEFGVVDSPMGLRVASIATDSTLRIYTSLDPSLSDWSLSHEVHIPSLLPSGASGASGDEVDGHTAMASQQNQYGGSGVQQGSGLAQGAGVARDGRDGAGAGGSGGAGTSASGAQSNQQVQEAAMGGWGLSWCRERWWGGVVAVIAGTSPAVKIINLDPTPSLLLTLASTSTQSPLTSLAWAPNCGRAYHHIATGARDGTVRIWKVVPGETDEDEGDQGQGQEWKGEVVAEFARGARVGMVEWNATGTVLTVSDDDGVVRMYKATYDKSWKLAGKISAEEPSDD